MRKAIIFLVLKLCVVCTLLATVSCGPSAEEKAAMEKAKEDSIEESKSSGAIQDPGKPTRIKIVFGSGAIDTITYNVIWKLELIKEDLYDHEGGHWATIAHHVDAFSIIE